jgi:hypothetical protein
MKKELNKTKSVFEKKSKMSLAKSTTALTCLVGALIVSSDLGAATGTVSMIVSSSIASYCNIAASTMTFGEYSGAQLTATSVITQDCNSSTFTISLSETPDAGSSTYYLYKDRIVSIDATKQLGVVFAHPGGTMIGSTVAITGTGAGSTSGAAVATITGTMAGGQSGKASGSFGRTMTLNLTY